MIKKIFILLLIIPLTMLTDGDEKGLAMKYDEKLKIEDDEDMSAETEIRPIELLEPLLDPTIKPIELLEPILDPNIKPVDLLEPKFVEEIRLDELKNKEDQN